MANGEALSAGYKNGTQQQSRFSNPDFDGRGGTQQPGMDREPMRSKTPTNPIGLAGDVLYGALPLRVSSAGHVALPSQTSLCEVGSPEQYLHFEILAIKQSAETPTA
jgi:hypothetical protein